MKKFQLKSYICKTLFSSLKKKTLYNQFTLVKTRMILTEIKCDKNL